MSDPKSVPESFEPSPEELADSAAGESAIPGVGRRVGTPVSIKGVLAVGLLLASLIAMSGYSIHRFVSGRSTSDEPGSKRASDRPSTATAEPRRLDLTLFAAASSSIPASSPYRVPAIVPGPEDGDPIGVRRTSAAPSTSAAQKPPSPLDAPAMLVTSRAGQAPGKAMEPNPGSDDTPATAARQRLEAYQRQLQVMLDNLTRSGSVVGGSAGGITPGGTLSAAPAAPAAPSVAPVSPGLFGVQLQGSGTAKTVAGLLGNRSLTLPMGTAFTCALKTRIVSATSGLVGCQVQRDVYGEDGRVLLIERGTHLDGEYRVTSMRPGAVRIPVLWTRIRTPEGVVVDIESPGTGPLGEAGIDGHVDNRWFERIGAAMLLSLVDDAVTLAVRSQQDGGRANTLVLPGTTGNASQLAEKVLESTVNIPPLIYRNQGGIVGIHVARDVDFSSVYELRATAR